MDSKQIDLFSCLSLDSYIKPQLKSVQVDRKGSCLSLDSYIKPQLMGYQAPLLEVVYLLIPTSNHNRVTKGEKSWPVVYLLIPTSNHNLVDVRPSLHVVVYLLIPTSNHNVCNTFDIVDVLFIS